MINILKKKNTIFFAIIYLTIFLIFLIYSGFSVSAFTVSIAGTIGFYLMFYRKQNILFIFALSLAVFFLIFYLVQNNNLPSWSTLVLLSLTLYLFFYFFLIKDLGNKYQTFYIFIIVLVLGEILVVINYLTSVILIKSLIISVCFYLTMEMIKLNYVNKQNIINLPSDKMSKMVDKGAA